MKKQIGLKLSPEMTIRLSLLMEASGLKRNTIIERAVALHLPELEKRYARELAEEAEAAKKREAGLIKDAERLLSETKKPHRRAQYPQPGLQASSLNEPKT